MKRNSANVLSFSDTFICEGETKSFKTSCLSWKQRQVWCYEARAVIVKCSDRSLAAQASFLGMPACCQSVRLNVMQMAHTHSYMSVLAHKLTYRWYPWGNFNSFQTVCLHQRTWYHLWDQASSKWFRMSKFSWRIQCTSVFHCFPAWFQDGSHQGTSKTCTSSSLILCNGLQVYPFAWMILRCGLWCG